MTERGRKRLGDRGARAYDRLMDRTRRRFVALIAALGCALLAATPAAGKDGVRATLENPGQLSQAAAGERVRVAWTLGSAAQGPALATPGRIAPRGFGASGVYVRIRRASGAAPQVVSARPGSPAGRYVADVTIPEGGISSIAIGLEGYRYVRGQAPARADVLFAIDNDPFAAGSTTDGVSAPWLAPAAVLGMLGGLAVLGSLFVVLRAGTRRRSVA